MYDTSLDMINTEPTNSMRRRYHPKEDVASASQRNETVLRSNGICIESNNFKGLATFFPCVFGRILMSWSYEEMERKVVSGLLTSIHKHYSKLDPQLLTTISRRRLVRQIRTVSRKLGAIEDEEHKTRAKCESLLTLMNNKTNETSLAALEAASTTNDHGV